jgi:hypothetical protein
MEGVEGDDGVSCRLECVSSAAIERETQLEPHTDTIDIGWQKRMYSTMRTAAKGQPLHQRHAALSLEGQICIAIVITDNTAPFIVAGASALCLSDTFL